MNDAAKLRLAEACYDRAMALIEKAGRLELEVLTSGSGFDGPGLRRRRQSCRRARGRSPRPFPAAVPGDVREAREAVAMNPRPSAEGETSRPVAAQSPEPRPIRPKPHCPADGDAVVARLRRNGATGRQIADYCRKYLDQPGRTINDAW